MAVIAEMAEGRSRNGGGYVPPSILPDESADGLVGFLRAMVRDPVSAIPAAAYEAPVTVKPLPGTRVAFVCDPVLLEQILIKRHQDFPKSLVDERIFRSAFGDGLLLAHGEDWRWKRRLAAPHFSPAALARHVPAMTAPFAALAQSWCAGEGGRPVDVSGAMTAATLDVINTALFTSRDEIDPLAVSQAIDDYLKPISWTIALASLKAPSWLPHPGKGRIRSGQRRMRKLAGDLIAARRTGGAPRDDICADLMSACDPESGRLLDDTDLVDMLLTLITAGHETSANALTWALYCLAEQPGLQEELGGEVRAVAGARPVQAEYLPSLVRVEAFLKETMRLFPPGPLLARRTVQPERLGEHDCPAGTTVFIPVYAIHRHKLLWEAPERFDPGRFVGEGARKIGRTVYMPFGSGPRVCIGWTFAMMEMVAGLATLLQAVRFSTSADTRCEPVQRVTLRPKHDLELMVEPV